MARYFKYFCRVCHKETLQKVDETDPAKTPIPYCCKSLRNSAYKGMVTLPDFCGADRDGECSDPHCPQLKDWKPVCPVPQMPEEG